ncbi:hypothetical protein L3X38_027747 [Prunus dulcis]|uniref:F-box domain-containing protein n=1 Tax=Prunus dulcis TaxID=3755 RepID=A0AAD4VND0_PRUDU|nr:hypothetical protein L3X38_027747 [Prunus dulcis]
MMTNDSVDDLPEVLLVEIICRVSCIKFVFQCKCVSKHWCELISSSHFVGQSVRHQRDLKTSILGTVVVDNGTFFRVENEDGLMSLQLPVISEATAELDQRDYHICNPYTKKWVALPPPPRIHNWVSVGFICDPYYSYNSSSSFDDDVSINVEYRLRVVRLRQEFYVDIFFSETGSDHASSYILELDPFQGISNISTSNGDSDGDHIIVDKCRFSLAPLDMLAEVRGYSISMYRVLGACRGHLRVSEFLLGDHLSVWELDAGDDNLKWRLVVDKVPFFQMDSPNSNDLKCGEIPFRCIGFLVHVEGICGTLRIRKPLSPIKDAGCDNLKWCLVVDKVPFFEVDSSYYEDVSLTPLDECAKTAIGFHPSIGDTIYVDAKKITRWNFGARMFELVPEIPSQDSRWNLNYIHPFVLPWWPTPVLSL